MTENRVFREELIKEFDGHMDKYSMEEIFPCIFCGFDTNDPIEILVHLNDKHNFAIQKLAKLAMLPQYLKYWRDHPPPFIDGQIYGQIKQTIDITNPEEIQLRHTLHTLRLNHVMAQHEMERTQQVSNVKCLFCNERFTGTWHDYLQSLFKLHNFNPGRPTNLVFIEDFVNLLRSQLERNICFNCGQQFNSQKLLRTHMKKKPHFKIPNQPCFDRFYMVNYLEEDQNWQEIEAEKEDDEEFESIEEGLRDFDENEVNETQCLICDYVATDPHEIMNHMRMHHNFDFNIVRQSVGTDFYKLVRFVNYARTMSSEKKCFICGVDVMGDYSQHIFEHQNKKPIDNAPFSDDDRFLIPVVPGDALLTILEDC